MKLIHKIADHILTIFLFLGMILNLLIGFAQKDMSFILILAHVSGMVGCLLGLIYMLIKDNYRKLSEKELENQKKNKFKNHL